MIGKTVAHYQVVEKIGEGGMGEVYRARDTRLNRDVALKVLPEVFADDRQRMARFSREAQVLASLNHPNIAAIYGLEVSEGPAGGGEKSGNTEQYASNLEPRDTQLSCLVMELVEGEDLSARISRGPIPIDEALPIALQIAEALESAHERGIIHRDLKPANIKLTPDGKVKVLDFGLAKALENPVLGTPASALSQSPTVNMAATQAGIILGTAAYMSPEQARGKAVDKKADVWSFGVVLWEMLTGRALFRGDTVTDVIASVVTKDPDQDALPPDAPRAVRRLLRRCLCKEPRLRLPDIGAARLELQEALSGLSGDAEAPAGRQEGGGRTREKLAWAALALVAVLLVAVALSGIRESPEPRPAVRFAESLPEGWTQGDMGWPAPSPDGRQVVFAALSSGGSVEEGRVLWSRPLDSLQPRQLPGTEGAEGNPIWSPDARFIAFLVPGELRRLELATGTVQRICALPRPGPFGGDWNEAGTIIFSTGAQSGQIYSVAATGGEAKVLTTPDAEAGETNHHMPQFLPDGEHFLFLVGSNREDGPQGLYVSSLTAPGEKRRVARGWTRSVYASGHLFCVREGTLIAQPFDPERVELQGEPVAIASSVGSWGMDAGIGWFSVSPGGTLAYFSGVSLSGRVQLAWCDAKGNQIETVGPPGAYGQISLSPDERNVAIEILDSQQEYDIWVMDLARGVLSRVTTTPGSERDPVWAPDGRSLIYVSRRKDGADLRRKGLRASDAETVVADSPDEDIPESWSRDGKVILLVRRTAEDKQSVWALRPDKKGDEEAVLDTGFRVDEPHLSPDGRWLAYVSAESGREDVYLEPFHGEGAQVRVSVNGGGQPKWRGDGRKLYFTDLTGKLMAVDVRALEDRVEVSLPQELFQLRGYEGAGYDDYAVSTDGQRFLVKLPVEQEEEQRLQVIANWPSLLQ